MTGTKAPATITDTLDAIRRDTEAGADLHAVAERLKAIQPTVDALYRQVPDADVPKLGMLNRELLRALILLGTMDGSALDRLFEGRTRDAVAASLKDASRAARLLGR